MKELTSKQKKALRLALAQTILEHMDEYEGSLIRDAEWATDDEAGPGEYWTPLVENYLHRCIGRAVSAAVLNLTGPKAAKH